MSTSYSVVVIGQGQVGRAIATVCHDAGHAVTGIDIDPGARDLACRNASYAVEPSIPSSTFDVLILAVQTGLSEGVPDLDPLERAAAGLAAHIGPNSLVINESTVYPGATEDIVLRAIMRAGAPSSFHLAYSPERIDPGNPTWTITNTPKLVAGATPLALEAAIAFYSTFVERVQPVATIREAEFAKLVENAFRAVNIAFANELAGTADALGIDISNVLDAAATKPFGYLDFRPGPGPGGHCIPVDPEYLAWRSRGSGSGMPLLESALASSAAMPGRIAQHAVDYLAGRSSPRVLLLGVSHKRNEEDMRGAPSIEIARRLLRAGATVFAVDEVIDPSRSPADVVMLSRREASGRRFDLAIHLTDHSQPAVSEVVPRGTPILDARRTLRSHPDVIG